MSGSVPPSARGRAAAGHLQVLSNPAGALTPRAASDVPPPRLRVADDRPRVVLAGGELMYRSVVRCELGSRLPDAVVLEAEDVWEVLQHAPSSRLVVLAGDLEDAPAGALVRLLAHRHPDLSVLPLYDRPLDLALPEGGLPRPAAGRSA